MKTLNELNQNPAVREWGTYTLETRYAVAMGGMKAGDKVHLIRTEVVLANSDPRPRDYKVGAAFSSQRNCNSNGQHTGRPVDGWDTDKITCAGCLKGLAR